MPSPRTDAAHRETASRWSALDPRGIGSLVARLNVRLVLTLAIVALVGLVVSGVAISQILPGYFVEQTEERMQTAAGSTAILLRQEIASESETRPGIVSAEETRTRFIVVPVARDAARVFTATATILDARGDVVTRAVPPEPEALEAQGLRKETDVRPQAVDALVDLPTGEQTAYRIVMSEPYSTRQETLEAIRGALIGAGLLALVVSVITGIIAARSLTVPISRLRSVAGRVAQGKFDERAAPSGVLEIDELGSQFNVMADRLAGTLQMLEADRDRLREFVADVSHELRTPIAALRMYTELQRDGEVDEATRREFLERSLDQIQRLEWLSTNLLDLSRIDAGIYPLDMRTGDLRDPVQAVVQALSDSAVEHGVSLGSTVPAQPVELRFDRERVVQLMTNLIGNAIKFTPRGGAASVKVEERPTDVAIEVRDTGAGIPADEMPHIFERFYRGTNTGEARASGSGLGLAIVRSIVEMHGGEIDLASEVGKGTQVRITLPRQASDTAAPAESESEKVNETSRSGQAARNPGTIG
jgi:signal transduction histidine kinase